MAGLTDQHLLRLAPGEIEHLARNKIIDQNDVGRLQRANGAQREQFRVARTRADECHRSGLAFAGLTIHCSDEFRALTFLRHTFGLRDRSANEQLPEAPPPAEWE